MIITKIKTGKVHYKNVLFECTNRTVQIGVDDLVSILLKQLNVFTNEEKEELNSHIKVTETIYVIGPKSLFDQLYTDFLNQTGHYYEAGFKNWGAIRHSLDGQLTLLEETPDKFLLEHLNREDVVLFRTDQDGTSAEKCKAHLIANKNNWQQELE